MFRRIVSLAAIALCVCSFPRAWAGIYNTGDAPEETSRLSPDFEGVFRDVLLNLKSIPNPGSLANPPIRRRYLLIESLGNRGALDLQTVEAKLDYSAVLIRRNKAAQAVAILKPLADHEKHKDNFVVSAQCAMAHFLAGDPELRANAVEYMRQAMTAWPESWDQVDENQKKFLESLGWEEVAFQRNRKYEEYLFRLMKSRAKEERASKQKKPVAESVDPIFGPDKEAVRFVNEKGVFEPGRIALAESKKLPANALDIVEQLLIWMPTDDRLLWLLGEVLNAEAMNEPTPDKKDAAIRSAAAVFKQLNNDAFTRQVYAKEEIKTRHEALSAAAAKLPPPRHLDPEKFKFDADDDNKDGAITPQQWWRALIVGFITGLAVGLFALWQLQEVRRRRTARPPHAP